MKTKLLIALTLVVFFQGLKSQDSESNSDYFKTKFEGIDLGFSQMVDGSRSDDLQAIKSLYWGFNVYSMYLPISSDNLGLEIGAGGFIQSITFSNRRILHEREGVSPGDYEKMKYKNLGFHVPVLLTTNFKANNVKAFVQAGIMTRYNVYSMYKEKFENADGDIVKEKFNGQDYGVNDFNADLYVKLGTQNWAIFAQYGLGNYFDYSNANIFTFGFSFGID